MSLPKIIRVISNNYQTNLIAGNPTQHSPVNWFFYMNKIDTKSITSMPHQISDYDILLIFNNCNEVTNEDLIKLIETAHQCLVSSIIFCHLNSQSLHISEDVITYADNLSMPIYALSYNTTISQLTFNLGQILIKHNTPEKQIANLLEEILFEKLIDENNIVKIAREEPIKINRPHFILLVSFSKIKPPAKLYGEIENFFINQLNRRQYECTLNIKKDRDLIFLIPYDSEQYHLDNFKLVKALLNEFIKTYSPFTTFITAGNTYAEIIDFRKSYLEAKKVLEIDSKFIDDYCADTYNGLGAFHLLLQLENNPALRSYMERLLSPLLQYDKDNGSDFLTSLETYLYEDKNINQAAQKLFIHRNTLKYRLKKIESLIGYELESPHYCTDLMLAFYIYKLYE